MNNFLYYGTCPDQYQMHYANFQAPFRKGKEISTQLPKNIAVIRAVAVAVFASLAALKLSATIFCWPIMIAGLAFAGWTIYTHLLSKDPLMEAFYKILGGKDRFEALPKINLAQAPNEKICEAIKKIDWDNLNHSVARTRALDGRNVVIIKGLNRNNGVLFPNCQTKSVLAFVEKINPRDIPRAISNLPEIADTIMHAIFTPHEGNTFSSFLYSSISDRGNGHDNYNCNMYSSISSDIANELYTQLNTVEIQ
ncbi:hypothetical protein [Candidatus Protochlamydia sp. R18]|uniref:hypothetical protein n=1 Tax=Candidatus Protochlamydia sp. R18 TaxID=1353977 RepID=UPI0005A80B8A|nr:hypothetical protein [Candidatus Protochlamydia sp. R18]